MNRSIVDEFFCPGASSSLALDRQAYDKQRPGRWQGGVHAATAPGRPARLERLPVAPRASIQANCVFWTYIMISPLEGTGAERTQNLMILLSSH
mmetsp:Transcript_12738/g.24716  ORF Transcript_12738/g.24716 Transcript_12738/m.24716 type:complete len:94 (+) Transcript_12738:42-323(+)